MRMASNLFQALAEASMAQTPVALGVISGVKGSSPQKIGAKALFYADRSIRGTLGGGCLEAEVQRLALQSLRDGKPTTFELVLDHDFGWDDGLICGGKVSGVIIPNAQLAGAECWPLLAARKSVLLWGITGDFSIRRTNTVPSGWHYLERVGPPCDLWIAGSGHLAQVITPLALQLDFAVSIFDDRPELANHEIFPRAAKLHVGHWQEILTSRFANTPTFGLIVTRGHKHDALVLETWIHRPFQFLGMIGSHRKARTITEHFLKQKLATAEEIARVACPVGIRIKSQSVMEIAVDILAQYIDKRAEALHARSEMANGTAELL